MNGHHLAQFNLAGAVAPLDDPKLADFMARLDEINALAEASPGFVWRLQSDSGNATDIRAYDDPSGPNQTYDTHRTVFRGPPARRVARRDALRITSAAQRRPGASEVRPQGRNSRLPGNLIGGASGTLDDALRHRLRAPSFRGNGNCDPMGTICLI